MTYYFGNKVILKTLYPKNLQPEPSVQLLPGCEASLAEAWMAILASASEKKWSGLNSEL